MPYWFIEHRSHFYDCADMVTDRKIFRKPNEASAQVMAESIKQKAFEKEQAADDKDEDYGFVGEWSDLFGPFKTREEAEEAES